MHAQCTLPARSTDFKGNFSAVPCLPFEECSLSCHPTCCCEEDHEELQAASPLHVLGCTLAVITWCLPLASQEAGESVLVLAMSEGPVEGFSRLLLGCSLIKPPSLLVP